MYMDKRTFDLTKDYAQGSIKVDNHIAKILEVLNKKGFNTYSSYQGGFSGGVWTIGYIIFRDAVELDLVPYGYNVDCICYKGRLRTIVEMDLKHLERLGLKNMQENLLKWANKL